MSKDEGKVFDETIFHVGPCHNTNMEALQDELVYALRHDSLVDSLEYWLDDEGNENLANHDLDDIQDDEGYERHV